MQRFSRRSIVSYVLYNYTDTPDDLFTRVRDLLEWGAAAYPMRYQPLDELTKNTYVADAWTPEQLSMVDQARRVIGTGGAFPPHKGLIKKFQDARDFNEAFELRPVGWRDEVEVQGTKDFKQELRKTAEDHEWPAETLFERAARLG